MSDPRTDRIAAIAARLEALAPLEPLAVRLARRAHELARVQLHERQAAAAPHEQVEALRYRVLRTHDVLEQRWHDAALGAAHPIG
jgi:hypothetical protein